MNDDDQIIEDDNHNNHYDNDNDNNEDSQEAWMTAFNFIGGVVSSVMCLVGIFFMVAIFKTRKFTFNLYIIFAILPDALCNGVLGASLLTEAFNGGTMPSFLCSWMCFHLTFYYLSNLFVNAVISKEVHNLVLSSFRRKRTKPPSTQRVIVQVVCVYASTGLVAGWLTAPVSWNIMTISNEPICISKFKNLWIGIAVNGAISMPPFLYVFWVAYKIHTQKLLPLMGRTRVLALYFMRIIVIFVAFYIPILLVATYGFAIAPDPEEEVVSTQYFVSLQVLKLFFPIQNIVTFKFMLQKFDIKDAVLAYAPRITWSFRRSTSTLILKNSGDDDSDNNNDGGVEQSEWMMTDVYRGETVTATTSVTDCECQEAGHSQQQQQQDTCSKQ